MFYFQFPKLCGYYRFEKHYFQRLKDCGIIIVCLSNWVELVEEEEEEGSVDSPEDDKQRKKGVLEHKLDNLMWKMNMVHVACFVIGCVLMYVVMK